MDQIWGALKRGAAKAVLDQLEARPKAGIPVLHWFSGTHAELRRAVDLGAWFSVGPAMLRGDRGRKLAQLMPRDRVLTETDGPFGRTDSGPLMPWDSAGAEVSLAEIWGTSPTEASGTISNNLRALSEHARLMEVR